MWNVLYKSNWWCIADKLNLLLSLVLKHCLDIVLTSFSTVTFQVLKLYLASLLRLEFCECAFLMSCFLVCVIQARNVTSITVKHLSYLFLVLSEIRCTEKSFWRFRHWNRCGTWSHLFSFTGQFYCLVSSKSVILSVNLIQFIATFGESKLCSHAAIFCSSRMCLLGWNLIKSNKS